MMFSEIEISIMSRLLEKHTVVLEAVSDLTPSYIIRDNIYPKIEDVLKTPSGDRAFKRLVEKFVDRNSEKLHEACPISMIAFMDSDKADYFNLFRMSESESRKSIREMLSKISSLAEFKLITQNPIFVVLYCCIRFYKLKKDKIGLNASLVIYALSSYPSIFHKYFKYGVNEGVMRYTADQLTEKYIFRTAGHVFGALSTSINSSFSFLEPNFVDMEDKEVVRFIQRVRNDQNSLIKKIAIRYHDNHKLGNMVTTQTEVYDTGDLIDDRHSDTSIVDTLSDKISLNMITNGLDLKLLETAATLSQVSLIELRMYIVQILVAKKMNQLKDFVSSVLFVYLYDEKHSAAEIHSKIFLSFGLNLFRRTNSNDENISTIKSLLNTWGDDTGLHSKFRREHTRISYKKGIFWYILLSIQNIA